MNTRSQCKTTTKYLNTKYKEQPPIFPKLTLILYIYMCRPTWKWSKYETIFICTWKWSEYESERFLVQCSSFEPIRNLG